MKLYNIKRPEALFKTLDKLEGDVTLVMPDGGDIAWRRNRSTIRSMFSAVPESGIDRMEIHTGNARDALNIMDFMIRGNCA